MFNNIFNQNLMKKYLKRHDKKFKLTHKKKEIILKWIKNLENNELTEEVANYGLFSRLILENLLEYNYEEDIKENVKEDYGKGFSEFTLQRNNKPFMVIELKGQNISLDHPQNRAHDKKTPIDQAFDYSKHSGEINWILISNYQEFRLYNWHTKKHQHIHFNITELLQPEIFQQFMLTFSKHSTKNHLPEKLLTKTQFIEKNFETEFYKLYHETRLMLINELEHQHPLFTRNQSVHYAQLILNRYIFICFAEDLGLLPEQITFKTIHNPIKNHDLGRGEIWHRLNELFLDINEGNDYKKIYGYNGGLFSETLEHLKIRDIIDDHTLFKDTYTQWKFEEHSSIVEEKLKIYTGKINPIYKNLLTISTFDFSSELDVNIFGHIFENSIGDIEELQKSSKGRRKKEGIYYTPDHITDYICKNTILPYLSKTGTPNTIDGLINEYYGETELLELDEKVKNIKILDPACGSGAFLNKSSDILLEIHEKIHKELYKSDNTLKPFFDPIEERRKILLENIYGVDLNEESVEITKLSLFLKVCKEGLKLPNLNNNIRQGNSLIDNPEYTEHPFNWKEEFKEIMENGGFDIIIGNPPYVSQKGTLSNPNIAYNEREYYRQNYKTLSENGLKTRGGVKLNLFGLWIEKSLNILIKNGILGLIVHKNLLKVESYKFLRKYIIKNSSLIEIIDLGSKIFPEVTGETIILILLNRIIKDNNVTIKTKVNLNRDEYDINQINQDNFFNNDDYIFNIYETEFIKSLKYKLYKGSITLESAYKIVSFGLNTSNNKKYFVKDKLNNEYKKAIMGRNIAKWTLKSYGYVWYNDDILTRKGDENAFNSDEKLILQRICSELTATYDNNQIYCYNSTNMIIKRNDFFNLKYLLCLLNSKLINYFYTNVFSMKAVLTVNVTKGYLSKIPIKNILFNEQREFINKADKMLQLHQTLNDEIKGFKDWLQRTYHIEKFSMKLEKYYELTFDEFLLELKKKKIDTTPRKVQETLKKEYHNSIQKIQPLILEIRKTDQEIDQMLYKLYELTPEEIQTIETTPPINRKL